MKWVSLVVLAFLVGFGLGGWPPRSDLYTLEGRIAELEARLATKAYDGNPSLSGITRMLNVPEKAVPVQEVESVAAAAPEAEPASEPVVLADKTEVEPVEPVSFRERIEEAAELWGMRTDLARNGFLGAVAASPEQALRFDVVMEAMNLRLEASIAHWAEVLDKGSMPPREAGIRMMKDVTEALSIAYDDLDQGLPVSWKRDAGKSFQIVDYIDPLIALPLAEVENKLDFD